MRGAVAELVEHDEHGAEVRGIGVQQDRLARDRNRVLDPGRFQSKLLDARAQYPNDLSLRGYTEILRNSIVKDFVTHPKGMQAVPRLSAEFLTNFDRFNLNAQEGYLVSLIDGRFDLQKLLILSPFDPFTTLFSLAKLQNERAISVPQ